MITMRDIAHRAGVSRSTVSFVLNDKHVAMGVNEDTRLRVLKVADELGYRRNEMARAINTGKMPVFGFLVLASMLHHEVAASILNGVLDEADAIGYTVQVIRLSGANDEESIRRCLEIRPTGVMGVYIHPETLELLQQEMSRFHIPVAVVDSVSPLAGTSRILSDDVEGCRQAIAHLVSLGHKHIARIGGTTTSVVGKLRAEGYQTAMAEHNLAILPGYEENGHWMTEVVEEATLRLFRDHPVKPTALFCFDDKTAMIACRILRSLGLRVPEDVSLVGFADLAMAAYNDPPLTTISQPFRAMGKRAVVRLLSASHEAEEGMDKGNDYYEELLPTRLVVRKSTAPPKGDS